MPSKIEVISKAFTLLGEGPVNDLTATPQTGAASALFDSHYASTLASEQWRFSIAYAQLSELLSPPPIEEFTHAYQIPSNLITLIQFIPNGNYTIVGDEIWTNIFPKLELQYVKLVTPDTWPVYFTVLMEFKMAWLIAPFVTQNFNITEYWGKVAEEELLKARYLNSQQEPNRMIRKNRMWGGHFIGGGSFR